MEGGLRSSLGERREWGPRSAPPLLGAGLWARAVPLGAVHSLAFRTWGPAVVWAVGALDGPLAAGARQGRLP